VSNIKRTITIDCPGDKLHEVLWQCRDMGWDITVEWDALNQVWVVKLLD
jgi:hypothetical protein